MPGAPVEVIEQRVPDIGWLIPRAILNDFGNRYVEILGREIEGLFLVNDPVFFAFRRLEEIGTCPITKPLGFRGRGHAKDGKGRRPYDGQNRRGIFHSWILPRASVTPEGTERNPQRDP